MAGRIMTRMTTDVDQFESLIENGLLAALVAFVTFVGVGVALLLVNLELGLCTLSVVVPLAVATVSFRRRAARLYDLSRERIAIVNADFQESLSGVRESQAFVHEAATIGTLPPARCATTSTSRVAAQRLVATYFPFVQFLSAVADAIVLGVGAALIAHGAAHRRRADRVPALHRHVLLADPAAVAGVRLLAADPGVGAAGSPT